MSASRRGVRRTQLRRVLANLLDLVLREQPSQFHVLQGARRYGQTGNGRSRTRIRHIENHQNARAVGSNAVHRKQLSAGRFDKFSSCLLAIGLWIFQNGVESAWCVLSGEAKMHGMSSSELFAIIFPAVPNWSLRPPHLK